jgi:hypothetical protein
VPEVVEQSPAAWAGLALVALVAAMAALLLIAYNAATAPHKKERLVIGVVMRTRTTFPKEWWGDQPHLKLYNATTLASVGSRRITQMSDLCIKHY